MGVFRLTESEFTNLIETMIKEGVEHFLNKWGYPDRGEETAKVYEPWDDDILVEMDKIIEKFGWQISPMAKPVEKNGKKYNAYICIPNEDAPRIGDWAYVAGELNMIAGKHGMVVEQGRYKNIANNRPEEEKPKKIKRGMQPEAESDKTGAHYFIIKPRSESNF